MSTRNWQQIDSLARRVLDRLALCNFDAGLPDDDQSPDQRPAPFVKCRNDAATWPCRDETTVSHNQSIAGEASPHASPARDERPLTALEHGEAAPGQEIQPGAAVTRSHHSAQ